LIISYTQVQSEAATLSERNSSNSADRPNSQNWSAIDDELEAAKQLLQHTALESMPSRARHPVLTSPLHHSTTGMEKVEIEYQRILSEVLNTPLSP
jgi:hypothetical protein